MKTRLQRGDKPRRVHEVSGESRTRTVVLPRETGILAASACCRPPSSSQALQRNRARNDFWRVKIPVLLWENPSPSQHNHGTACHGSLRGYCIHTRDTPNQTAVLVPRATMVGQQIPCCSPARTYSAPSTFLIFLLRPSVLNTTLRTFHAFRLLSSRPTDLDSARSLLHHQSPFESCDGCA